MAAAAPAVEFTPCADSAPRDVKYLGRIRLQKKPTSSSCVEALDGLRADFGVDHGMEFTMTISCAQGFIHAIGTQGEMKHPLFQIVCVTTVDNFLCYALAIAAPQSPEDNRKKFFFNLHGFEVSQ
jgi:hypothetical protein